MKTFNLKRGTINKIANAVGVTHSAVSQWFSGRTEPGAKAVAIMERDFGIPSIAWLDIKSYLNTTNKTPDKSNTKSKKEVS